MTRSSPASKPFDGRASTGARRRHGLPRGHSFSRDPSLPVTFFRAPKHSQTLATAPAELLQSPRR